MGDRPFIYDPNNYLVLSVPLPFECETETGADAPLLGFSIRMETSVISELAATTELPLAGQTDDDLACATAMRRRYMPCSAACTPAMPSR